MTSAVAVAADRAYYVYTRNGTELEECTRWTYETDVYESTIASQVRKVTSSNHMPNGTYETQEMLLKHVAITSC